MVVMLRLVGVGVDALCGARVDNEGGWGGFDLEDKLGHWDR